MSQRSALKNRNFQVYLGGAAISMHGLWIFRVALAWYAWQLTQSEAWVGIIAFTQFAPAMIFGPLFGVMADRFERRKVSMIVNSGSALNMFLLATLSANELLGIVLLTCMSFLQGTLDGAHVPVRMSLVPSIVEPEELSSAIASNSIAFNLSRIIGPAVAGFIILHYGVTTAFALNGVSYIAIVIAVAVISIRPRKDRGRGPTDVWSQLVEGVRYVRGHALLRIVLVTIMINTVFGRGALEMMPAVADEILRKGSAGLAAMTSAVGVGAVAIGLFLASGTRWLHTGTLKIALLVAAVLIVAFGFSEQLMLTLAVVCLLGVVLSLGGIGSQILIQSNVDDEVRGRVSSLWGMIAFGGTALGSVLIGVAADLFGLRLTLMAAGLMCLLMTLFLPWQPQEADAANTDRTAPGDDRAR